MSHPARRYRITGRVQGVGFRWWTVGEARALDLAGWVRNEPDGSVTAVAAGPAEALAAFGARLAEGPRFSRVDGIAAEDVAAEALPDPFDIRR